MRPKSVLYTGIIGAGLFVLSSVIGGFLVENYSISSQYISESYAIDTEYGLFLRIFGYIPAGVLLAIFSFQGLKYFPPGRLTKLGFYGFGIFYGLATVITGIFPCDSGCNSAFVDPSISQIIHNLTGLLTYIIVPVSLILVGAGLKASPGYQKLSVLSMTCGLLSMLFIYLMFGEAHADYRGLYQRIVEAIFLIWVIACAVAVKSKARSN